MCTTKQVEKSIFIFRVQQKLKFQSLKILNNDCLESLWTVELLCILEKMFNLRF